MAKASAELYNNESFKSQLMELSSNIIWKNLSEAKSKEVHSALYLTELFIAANRGMLTWDIVRAFPEVVLQACGVVGLDVKVYASDKNKIPAAMRPTVVAEYQKALCAKNPVTGHLGYAFTETTHEEKVTDPVTLEVSVMTVPDIKYYNIFTEQNDYYRMLNGLPARNDTEYVYNTDPRWSTTTPIHEMSLVDRLSMESEGVLDQLIAKYPTKKYLKYCGQKMIDIYTARCADRFEILWINSNGVNSTLLEDFRTIYDGCKNQVNAVYYSEAFKKTNDLLDNFLAMCVLFMTIQTMMYRYLSVDVVRDFYDTDSLKYVYDSYNVPFYQEIPLEYHRKIVKNINRLIGYKGSSKVFLDLFDIFDLAEMDIYSYYITKQHIMDSDGNPVFIYERDENGEIRRDETGAPILADDQSAAYKIGFARSEVCQDPSLAIADPDNAVDAGALIDNDPYWVMDQALVDKLNEASFNFTESKYIGVQTVFDLLKIAYENAYLFKMIMDNREVTDRLTFRWAEMGINASVFDLMLYMAALFCKVHGYTGEIDSKLPFTAAVLGYDFAENLVNLQKYIAANEFLSKDAELTNLILNMNIDSLPSVSAVFDRIYEIREFLIQRYTDAHSIEEFETYKQLYDTLMTSSLVADVFTKADGTVAKSFADMLMDTCPELATRLDTLGDSELEDEMQVAIDKIEEVITSCRYMPFSAGMDSSGLFDALFKILKFFKSAEAELAGYNIVYRITMRGISFFKLLDRMVKSKTWGALLEDDEFQIDLVTYIKDTIKYQGDLMEISRLENIHSHYKLEFESRINWYRDRLQLILTTLGGLSSDMKAIDILAKIVGKSFVKSIMQSGDSLDLTNVEYNRGYFSAYHRDTIKYLIDELFETAGVVYIREPNLYLVYQKSLVETIVTILNINESDLVTDHFDPIHFTTKMQSIQSIVLDAVIAHFQGRINEIQDEDCMDAQFVSWVIQYKKALDDTNGVMQLDECRLKKVDCGVYSTNPMKDSLYTKAMEDVT